MKWGSTFLKYESIMSGNIMLIVAQLEPIASDMKVENCWIMYWIMGCESRTAMDPKSRASLALHFSILSMNT